MSNCPLPICGVIGSYLKSHIQINVEVAFFPPKRFKTANERVNNHLICMQFLKILLSSTKIKLQY